MAYFSLPVEKAFAKSREHAELVARHLGKPLHEASIAELRLATFNTLKKHPDFQMEGGIILRPKRGRRYLYSHYEIGHHLLCERVISKLKQQRKLPGRYETAVRMMLGRLSYNEPPELIQERLTGTNKLVKTAGKKRAEQILRDLVRAWDSQAKEANKSRQDYSQAHEVAINDLFSNPLNHAALSELKPETIKRKGIAAAIRERLKRIKTVNQTLKEEAYNL